MPNGTEPPRRKGPTGPVTLLCEGTHDAAFLAALLRRNSITSQPDLPFFWEDKRGFHQFPNDEYGAGGTTLMLALLASEISADPLLQDRVRGIILVRDCGDASSAKTFNACSRALKRLGFAAPRRPAEWGERSAVGPRVAVLLIPGADRKGGLETLCLDYLREKNQPISACIQQFFQCVPRLKPQRTAEKQHKAEMACAIAALDRESPTRSLAYCFSGSEPLIDVTAACFQAIIDTLRNLFRSALIADGTAAGDPD